MRVAGKWTPMHSTATKHLAGVKCSPKEQEWRQVFIEARERPFAILWEESRIVLKYRDFKS